MSTGAPVFELERFSAAPVSGDVAVVEVGGRFGDGGLNGDTPHLLIEGADGTQLELPALGPISGPAGRWQASFAVPAEQLHAGSAFALALRDVLLDLPEPDTRDGDGDRLVALARELNGLRRELDLARERAEAADARVAQAREEAQADKDRALTEAAARMETALREARERSAADLAEAAKAHAQAQADLEAQRTRAAAAEREREKLTEELREVRRAQKTARAESEALRRERDNLARELEKAQKVIPKGQVGSDLATSRPEAAGAGSDPADEASDDAPAESVRVLGREGPRRVPATAVLPPVDAELPPPPILSYLVAAVIFVIFVVVLMLLLI